MHKKNVLYLGFVAIIAVLGLALSARFLPEARSLYRQLMDDRSATLRYQRIAGHTEPVGTPYDEWLDRMRGNIPMFEGLVIEDVRAVPVQPWPEMGKGISGLYLRLADYQITDGRILELAADASTRAEQHLFEMDIYFLGGPGHTLFFRRGARPLRVDWREGSLLAVPLNVPYQHFNDTDQPVRLLAITSFPFTMNAWANDDFILSNPFEFSDRFDGSSEYFQLAVPGGDKRVATNFITDVPGADMHPYDERGEGSMTTRWTMAGNTQIDLHASEIPPMQYKRAHRHSSDAFILILSGDGYSLTWPGEKLETRTRVDWKKGTLFVPPTYWYHQHLNVGRTPARYLAINAPALVRNLGLRFYDQIEQDSPEIRAEWERTVQEHQSRLK